MRSTIEQVYEIRTDQLCTLLTGGYIPIPLKYWNTDLVGIREQTSGLVCLIFEVEVDSDEEVAELVRRREEWLGYISK